MGPFGKKVLARAFYERKPLCGKGSDAGMKAIDPFLLAGFCGFRDEAAAPTGPEEKFVGDDVAIATEDGLAADEFPRRRTN
jgi:hypothetical protein